MEVRRIDNIQWKKSENVKVNGTNTSAIIEDADNTLTYFADKYIVTKYPLSTGDIVEYAGIKYIIISQIDRNIEGRDENKYNYRARMRQADFNIKLIIDGEVKIIPSIIEGMKFDILDGQVISLSDDGIIATIKAYEITNKIKKEMRFIKLGQAWKVVSIDKTKKGLITLFCDADVFGANDDKENEIADTNLIDDSPSEPEPEEPIEPENNIIYNTTVQSQFEGDDGTEIFGNEWCKYTVHKIVNGEEVAGKFTFEIDNENIAIITNVTDNTVTITAKRIIKTEDLLLTATDVETNEIAIQKTITILGR